MTPVLALSVNSLAGGGESKELPRWALWAVLASLPVMVPLEEWLFRGVILRRLAPRVGAVGAVVVSAALFAIAHFSLSGAMGRFAIGLVLGVLYLATRSLWPGIAAHAMNNVGLLVLLLLS